MFTYAFPSNLRRTFGTLAAMIVLGAGGGATATLALDRSPTASAPAASATVTTRSAVANTVTGLTVNDIYRRTKQGIVDITVTAQGSGAIGPFGDSQGSTTAEGSGFVIDQRGDIVTNQHVVSGADSIEVKFADGHKASAQLVGEDSSTDVAVIRVRTSAFELRPLTFAESSQVEVGDAVVAVGSSYGLSGTVTSGIVSALGRSITAPNNHAITGVIQTDAPINRGNSGGPLLNAEGNVVGVNSQIASSSGDNSGVGFAIPSDTVREVAQHLLS